MRKVTYDDMRRTFAELEGKDAVKAVEDDDQVAIAEVLMPEEWMNLDRELLEPAMLVSHFGAFCAGVLTAQRILEEGG